ncbi:MAG: class I SAM-dependent methyltransferase, partial [Pseudomonadota bacterium]
TGQIIIDTAGEAFDFALPKQAAHAIAGIDGRRSLGDIRAGTGMDAIAFGALWAKVEGALCASGMMHYSRLLVT